jgi:hypothetical protein
MTLPQDHLLALGLADARLELVETHPTPDGDVGYGLTAEAPPAVDARAALEAHPFLTRLALAAPAGDLEVLGADRDPGIFVLSGGGRLPPGLVVRGCSEQTSPGERLVDAREAPASVLVPVGAGGLCLHLSRRGVEVFRVSLPAASEARGAALSGVTRPSLESLLGGREAEPWLRALWATAAPGDLAVVGTVGRLWSPPPGAARVSWDDLFAALAAPPAPWPRQAALTWARSLRPEARAAMAAGGVERARALVRELGALSEAVAAGPDAAAERVLAWLVGRDDLASLAALLEGDEAGAPLARALEDLDATATLHLSALSWPRLPPDDRLAAVASTEPDAWWGAVGTRDAHPATPRARLAGG